MTRKRVGRHPNEFRRMAVERFNSCENIVALAKELGIQRRLLYKWRDQFEAVGSGEEPPPENSREARLRKELSQLKRLLAEKALQVDFFRGARSTNGGAETRTELLLLSRVISMLATIEFTSVSLGRRAAVE